MNSIIKLVNIKKPSEILEKAKKYPIGTVRKWTTGQFKKEAERKWKPVSVVGSPANISKIDRARELGRLAFHDGINAPFLDSDMMALVDRKQVGEGIEPMKAWIAGWTEENLKAPVPGQVEAPKSKYGGDKTAGFLFSIYDGIIRNGQFALYAKASPLEFERVQKLASEGLVQVFEDTDSADGRTHFVTLTDKGRERAGLPEREPYPMIESPESAYGKVKVEDFIGRGQLSAMNAASRGEEGAFFQEKRAEMKNIFATMPRTYDTDGQGGKAVAYLHYFKGGSDWYITELDRAPEQLQAFGYAILNGDKEMAELGYISIKELIANGVELDLYYTPQTLNEIRGVQKSLKHKLVFGKSVPASVYEHKDVPGAGAKKRKKLKKKGDKVEAVMGEFKRGTLRSGSGEKVTDRKQAIAISLSEAGLSRKKK